MPSCMCCSYSRLLKALLVITLPVLLGVYLLPEEEPMEFPDIDKTAMASKTAFVLGYTGGIGKLLVREMLEKKMFKNVILIGRRQIDFGNDPLYKDVEQRLVDFDKIEDYQQAFEGASIGFCALGTTRAKSGKEGFIKVDHDYIINSAKVARAAGCEHYSLVSSKDAKSNSWVLYLKVKGQAEEAIEAMGFPRLTILRPGFLEGDREEQPTGHYALHYALKPIKFFRPTALSIPMVTVAKAAIVTTFLKPEDNKSTEILENAPLHHRGAHFDKMFG